MNGLTIIFGLGSLFGICFYAWLHTKSGKNGWKISTSNGHLPNGRESKSSPYRGLSYSMLLLTCSILSPIAMVPVMHPSIFAFCCFFIGFLLPILSTSSTALS